MTISYPVTAPTAVAPRSVRMTQRSVVGVSASPFTGQQQVYAHQGQWWEMDVQLPPMQRADAEAWISCLVSLNGREGTFLFGPPGAGSTRGTATAVTVSGASQTGRTLTVSTNGNLKAGDYFQLGSGSTARLHKILADVSSGTQTLDIWPALRSSPSNGAAVVIASPLGRWRLAANQTDWDINEALFYGLSFACVEAL
jgi:hypothetical protein